MQSSARNCFDPRLIIHVCLEGLLINKTNDIELTDRKNIMKIFIYCLGSLFIMLFIIVHISPQYHNHLDKINGKEWNNIAIIHCRLNLQA